MSDWTAVIRREALEMYASRAGLSERALAKRAYPALSEGAAQMRLRRRKRRDRVEVPGDEAKAIAAALSTPAEPTDRVEELQASRAERRDAVTPPVSFHWLESDVRWRLVDLASRPVAVGGAVYLFDHEGEAIAAGHLLARAGFPAGARAQALTIREAQDEAAQLGAPPLLNAESLTDSSLDDFEVLLDVERRLRGELAQIGELWLDGRSWPGWTEHLPHYAHALRHELRKADAEAAVELSARINAVVDLLHERAEALRPDAESNPAVSYPLARTDPPQRSDAG